MLGQPGSASEAPEKCALQPCGATEVTKLQLMYVGMSCRLTSPQCGVTQAVSRWRELGAVESIVLANSLGSVSERRLWPVLVVFPAPGLDRELGGVKPHEPVHAEALVSKLSIERAPGNFS